MTSYLQVENLSKSFGDKQLFEDISFGLSEQQRIALVAKNGCGKTTLLNILAGREDYDSGSITFRRDLRIGYLEQAPRLPEALSVLDACLQTDSETLRIIARYEQALRNGDSQGLASASAEMDRIEAWDYEARIKQILGKLRIDNFEQKIGTLSGGQLKRVALAASLISEPDLLILDEPTNHLDLEMVEWLEDFLKRSSMALLMVTHDRYFLDRVCSDILEIDGRKLFRYSGNYSYFLEKRQERIDNFNAETQRANKLYQRELEWMRRQPQARAGKAQSRIDRFHEIKERTAERRIESNMRLESKATYIGSKIFEARYISKAYGERKLLDNFYYNFARYEKLGIVGKNGSGKSTFLKMLIGEIKPDSGSFDIGQSVRFGYYSQETPDFEAGSKVIDVIRNIAEEVQLDKGRKMSASQFLQHFLFSPETQYNYVEKLSGGEKRRLHLCSVLMQNPNFLILDEPTNDLDIPSLNVLEEYLRNFKGCLIVVSHDRYFMDKIVDHLFVFHGDAQVQDFPGNYSQYRVYRRNRDAGTKKNTKPENKAPVPNPKAERSKRLSYKEKKEFEALEQEISELEERKRDIETALSSGALDVQGIHEASKQYEDIKRRFDSISIRWFELAERSEQD